MSNNQQRKVIVCFEASGLPQALNLQQALQSFVQGALTAQDQVTMEAKATALASAIWDAQATIHDTSIVADRGERPARSREIRK